MIWTQTGGAELIWLVTLMHLLFYNEDLKPVKMYCIWKHSGVFVKLSYLLCYLTIEVPHLVFSEHSIIFCFYDKSCIDNLQWERARSDPEVVGPHAKQVKDICVVGLIYQPDFHVFHVKTSAQSKGHKIWRGSKINITEGACQAP